MFKINTIRELVFYFHGTWEQVQDFHSEIVIFETIVYAENLSSIPKTFIKIAREIISEYYQFKA